MNKGAKPKAANSIRKAKIAEENDVGSSPSYRKKDRKRKPGRPRLDKTKTEWDRIFRLQSTVQEWLNGTKPLNQHRAEIMLDEATEILIETTDPGMKSYCNNLIVDLKCIIAECIDPESSNESDGENCEGITAAASEVQTIRETGRDGILMDSKPTPEPVFENNADNERNIEKQTDQLETIIIEDSSSDEDLENKKTYESCGQEWGNGLWTQESDIEYIETIRVNDQNLTTQDDFSQSILVPKKKYSTLAVGVTGRKKTVKASTVTYNRTVNLIDSSTNVEDDSEWVQMDDQPAKRGAEQQIPLAKKASNAEMVKDIPVTKKAGINVTTTAVANSVAQDNFSELASFPKSGILNDETTIYTAKSDKTVKSGTRRSSRSIVRPSRFCDPSTVRSLTSSLEQKMTKVQISTKKYRQSDPKNQDSHGNNMPDSNKINVTTCHATASISSVVLKNQSVIKAGKRMDFSEKAMNTKPRVISWVTLKKESKLSVAPKTEKKNKAADNASQREENPKSAIPEIKLSLINASDADVLNRVKSVRQVGIKEWSLIEPFDEEWPEDFDVWD